MFAREFTSLDHECLRAVITAHINEDCSNIEEIRDVLTECAATLITDEIEPLV